MEGDGGDIETKAENTAFQSTPSAWRETHRGNKKLYRRFYFNPLPPHGGRRVAEVYFCLWLWYFNPLPPHGGRLSRLNRRLSLFSFQSTPSAWRETIRLYLTVHMESVFQSTPSAWRETYRKSLPVDNIEISIHSLRMEGDLFIRN